MTRFTFKRLIGMHDNDDHVILNHLRDLEALLVSMIRGIVLFFWETIPDVFRRFLNWLNEAAILSFRIVIRIVRVVVVLTVWTLVVFGPLALYPGFISAGWMALTIAGSAWGIHRHLRPRVRVMRYL